MTGDEIFELLVKNMKQNMDGLEATPIDRAKVFKDYGASSLDTVEILSSTMRQAKIRVPRTELSKVRSIGELVDLLERSQQR